MRHSTNKGVKITFVQKNGALSIWENTESMKNFAYKMKEHQTVIQKTKKEDWYSEDMFTRFEVLNIMGSLK